MNKRSMKRGITLPRTKKQFEDMRIKSIQVINEAALKLFISKGYHSTTINAIAKEAGVAVGLMYNYFSSKEELLVRMIDGHFANLIDGIREEIGLLSHNTDVRILIDALINAVAKSGDSWKLIISVMFQPDVAKTARERIDAFALHQQEFFINHFVTIGVSKPQESARALSIILHAVFMAYAYNENLEEMRLVRETVIERLLNEGV